MEGQNGVGYNSNNTNPFISADTSLNTVCFDVERVDGIF